MKPGIGASHKTPETAHFRNTEQRPCFGESPIQARGLFFKAKAGLIFVQGATSATRCVWFWLEGTPGVFIELHSSANSPPYLRPCNGSRTDGSGGLSKHSRQDP